MIWGTACLRHEMQSHRGVFGKAPHHGGRCVVDRNRYAIFQGLESRRLQIVGGVRAYVCKGASQCSAGWQFEGHTVPDRHQNLYITFVANLIFTFMSGHECPQPSMSSCEQSISILNIVDNYDGRPQGLAFDSFFSNEWVKSSVTTGRFLSTHGAGDTRAFVCFNLHIFNKFERKFGANVIWWFPWSVLWWYVSLFCVVAFALWIHRVDPQEPWAFVVGSLGQI